MAYKSIKERRLVVLNDTINHYNLKNLSFSCIDKNKYQCFYYPQTDKTEGCAIGRLIKDKELCKEFGSKSLKQVFEYLPSNLKGLGSAFLSDLQGLHDVQKNWNKIGLSKMGLRRVEIIKKEYSL